MSVRYSNTELRQMAAEGNETAAQILADRGVSVEEPDIWSTANAADRRIFGVDK